MGQQRTPRRDTPRAHHVNTARAAPPETTGRRASKPRVEIAPLLKVARRARRTLKPVVPAPAFREGLREKLIITAQHQQEPLVLIERRSRSKWGWLLGAATIGSAGLIAVVFRSRADRPIVPQSQHPPA